MTAAAHASTIESLHREHGARIRRYLARLVGASEADDLAQDVFEKAQRATPKLRSAIPSNKRPAAFPDGAWAPLAGAALVLIVGAAGLLAVQPWLLPSLGPSAYLVAESAAHPSARAYNVFGGHLIGLGAGFVGVWIFGAAADPAVLQSGTLTGSRVAAAALAMLLATLVAIPLRASHPPAAATTLLVALGSISTGSQALNVVVGAAILAVAGEALRSLRMGKLRARKARGEARRRAPPELADVPR